MAHSVRYEVEGDVVVFYLDGEKLGRIRGDLSAPKAVLGRLDTEAMLNALIRKLETALELEAHDTHDDCTDACDCYTRGVESQIENHCDQDDCPGFERGREYEQEHHADSCYGDCACAESAYDRGHEAGDETGHSEHPEYCESECGCFERGVETADERHDKIKAEAEAKAETAGIVDPSLAFVAPAEGGWIA